MESRKLIAFGKSSLVISLPREWVKNNKLDKGDSVYVDKLVNELKISIKEKEKKEELKEIVISTENKSLDYIETEIVSAYLRNYDVIKVKGRNLEKDAMKIKDIVGDLAGLEILEQTTTEIITKDLLDIKGISVKALVRRIDTICKSMINDSIENIGSDYYESVFQRDFDINRLVFLAYRVMRKALINPGVAILLKTNPIDLLTNWEVVMRLEKIGDQSKRFCRYIRNSKLKQNDLEELKKIFNSIKNSHIEVMKAYYTNNKELAYKIAVENKKKIEMCNKFLETHRDATTTDLITSLKSMTSSIKHIARSVIGNAE